MCAIKDNLLDLKRKAHEELCSREPEPKCEYCKGSGEITRTEWYGTDTSVDTVEKCVCQEE